MRIDWIWDLKLKHSLCSCVLSKLENPICKYIFQIASWLDV